jgi:hypothetical protein
MIRGLFYPKSDKPLAFVNTIVAAFESVSDQIDSETETIASNEVLAVLTPHLLEAGFRVETGKKTADKIQVPVLFGMNGKLEKSFEADAYHQEDGVVLEIEAGRAVSNNQFLKDLFQACMMHDVLYLSIAIRNIYCGNPDFDYVVRFFDTMYASNRLQLPLKGLLVIGY